MPGLTLDDTMAGDVLRVALDDHSGRLRYTGVLAQAVRGALLIDLAAAGRLWGSVPEPQLDPSPTGLAVADELTAAVSEHPDRTLERLLRRGTPHLHDMIAELLADGCWTVERHGLSAGTARYVDADPARFRALDQRLDAIAVGDAEPDSDRDAAMACLAVSTGSTPATAKDRLEELIGRCGSLTWIVRFVIEYLEASKADALAAGIANTKTTVVQQGLI